MVGRMGERKSLLQQGWIKVACQQSRESWQRFQMNTSAPTFFYQLITVNWMFMLYHVSAFISPLFGVVQCCTCIEQHR